MKQAEMKELICPWLSGFGSVINCKGSKCMAFGSRPTTVYLAKNGATTRNWTDTLKLKEESSATRPLPKDFVDESEEIARLVGLGWRKRGVGTGIHMTREGEPDCWCDAMAGNAQCGYEAP